MIQRGIHLSAIRVALRQGGAGLLEKQSSRIYVPVKRWQKTVPFLTSPEFGRLAALTAFLAIAPSARLPPSQSRFFNLFDISISTFS